MQENKDNLAILILAGGMGKRMLNDLPKAMIELKSKPMISYGVKEAKEAFNIKPIVIIGHKGEIVRKFLGETCDYVTQEEQLGTGHAVSCAEDICKKKKYIIVLQCDQPLVKSETIKKLLQKHIETKAKITFTTTNVPDFLQWRQNFKKFGRIIREDEKIVQIKEYKDANDNEKNIKEVNAGNYIFEAPWIWNNLKNIKNENAQGEYYLTDLLKMAKDQNEKIESIQIDPLEALAANCKEELEILEKVIS